MGALALFLQKDAPSLGAAHMGNAAVLIGKYSFENWANSVS
jgi:hypothetical protein